MCGVGSRGPLRPLPRLVGGGSDRFVGGVELALAAPVGFVVGLGGECVDQFVEFGLSYREVKLVVVGADREDCSLAVIVEECQGSQDHCGVGVDDDVVERLGRGQPVSALVVDRSRPVADGAVVPAVTTAPADGLIRVRADHHDPAGAAAVGRSAPAGQSGLPRGVGVAGAGCGDDAGEVLGELACRPGGVGAQVEEVLQIGDQHDLVTVSAA